MPEYGFIINMWLVSGIVLYYIQYYYGVFINHQSPCVFLNCLAEMEYYLENRQEFQCFENYVKAA